MLNNRASVLFGQPTSSSAPGALDVETAAGGLGAAAAATRPKTPPNKEVMSAAGRRKAAFIVSSIEAGKGAHTGKREAREKKKTANEEKAFTSFLDVFADCPREKALDYLENVKGNVGLAFRHFIAVEKEADGDVDIADHQGDIGHRKRKRKLGGAVGVGIRSDDSHRGLSEALHDQAAVERAL
ncbi:unnamed protein product [Scytosiphon promiscuus]